MIFSKVLVLTIFRINANSAESIFLLRDSISDFATILLKMSWTKPAVISVHAEDTMRNARMIPFGKPTTEHTKLIMHAI